ncbi:MAG: DUF2914 domain-containing protein [Thermodesulfobacteriota bacterium]
MDLRDEKNMVEQENTSLVKQWLIQVKRVMPALAFTSGFAWDSITLGRVVLTMDLWILAAYLLGAAVVLLLLGRQLFTSWHRWFLLLLQFFFGGMFSAMVVLYFKSSGEIYTFLFVLLLAGLLLANEFLVKGYQRQQLSWAIFTLCGTMILNFLLPHVIHSVNAAWFYLSCAVSFGLVVLLRHLAHGEERQIALPGRGEVRLRYRSHLTDMIAPALMVGLILLLHSNNLIPPVPLVLKEQVVCHDLVRQGNVYTCQQEQQFFLRRLGLGQEKLTYGEDEKIFSLVAVFAPSHVQVNLEQRWLLWDRDKMEWRRRATVPLPMVGGRSQGWRTYSYIRNKVEAGKWKVETAVQDGAVLAYKRFILEPRGEEERASQPFSL